MIWVIAAAILIVITFALLPQVIRKIINDALRKNKGITGHVSRVGVNLAAGKVTLYDTALTQDSNAPEIKIAARLPAVVITFEWSSILRKTFVGDIILHKPELLIAATASSSTKRTTPPQESFDLKAALEKLIPFHVRLTVQDGQIRYANLYSKPVINVIIESVQLSMRDFSNIPGRAISCSIETDASLYEGSAKLNVTLFPLNESLTLDITLELRSINMVLLNDFLRAYGKVDVNRGTLELYSEIAVRGDSFKGYLKPILKDLDFIGIEDRGDNFFRKVWERVVAISIQVLENIRNDQIATKIPVEGRLNDPHVNIGAAIAGILKNAFIKTITPSLDNTGIGSVWKSAASRTKRFAKNIFKRFRSN